jgi:VanZ family protein
MWRAKLARWFQIIGLYLFWPAIAVICWGELTPQPAALETHIWDKALHFSAYFGLGGLICLALKADRRVVAATMGLVLFGGLLEIAQGFTGRDPSFYDELANTLGAVTGAGLGWLILWLVRSKALAPARTN